MIRGLQTHFNAPVDSAVLRELAARGAFVRGERVRLMARMDCQTLDEVELVEQTATVRAAGLVPLVIVTDAEQIALLARGDYAEPRNEPDTKGPDPATYRVLLAECAEAARGAGVTLCAPGVTNFTRRGFDYLRAIGPLPDGVVCSMHRYPPVAATWSTPHKGYRSREDEVRELRDIIGWARPFGISEFGYHTAPERVGWWIFTREKRRSDEQAAWDIAHEFAFWEAQGAAFAVAYQLNDDTPDTPLNRYGMRTVDGQWKPQAETFRS